MSEVSFRKIESLSAENAQDLFALFLESDFALPADGFEWLNDAIQGSMLAVGAFDQNGSLVGFARALGDNSSDCYIQDVTVSAALRGHGIGSGLVQYLLAELSKLHVDWVGLIATPGKADFYRRLGFEEMKEHTPMILKNLEQWEN